MSASTTRKISLPQPTQDSLSAFLAFYDTRHDMLGERCAVTNASHAKYCGSVKCFESFSKYHGETRSTQEEDLVMEVLATVDNEIFDFEGAQELLLGSSDEFKTMFNDTRTKTILQNRIIKVRLLKHSEHYKEQLKQLLSEFYNKNVGLHTDCIKLYFYDDVLDNSNLEAATIESSKKMFKFNSIVAYWDEASKDIDNSEVIKIASTKGNGQVLLNQQDGLSQNLFMPNPFTMNIIIDVGKDQSNSITVVLANDTATADNNDKSVEHKFDFSTLEQQTLSLSVAKLCSFLSTLESDMVNKPLTTEESDKILTTSFKYIDLNTDLPLKKFGTFIKNKQGGIAVFANFAYNLKRSLDYSQILLIEHLNKVDVDVHIRNNIKINSQSVAHTLITYDRLCFMKALMQKAPVIFQRKRGAHYELFIDRGNVAFKPDPGNMLTNIAKIMDNLLTKTKFPNNTPYVAQRNANTNESTIIQIMNAHTKFMSNYPKDIPILPINNELNTKVTQLQDIKNVNTMHDLFLHIGKYIEYNNYAIIQNFFGKNNEFVQSLQSLQSHEGLQSHESQLIGPLSKVSETLITISKIFDKILLWKEIYNKTQERKYIDLFDDVGMPYHKKYEQIPLTGLRIFDLEKVFKAECIEVERLIYHIEQFIVDNPPKSEDSAKAIGSILADVQRKGFSKDRLYKWNEQPSIRADKTRGSIVNYTESRPNLQAQKHAKALENAQQLMVIMLEQIQNNSLIKHNRALTAIAKVFAPIHAIRKDLEKLGKNRVASGRGKSMATDNDIDSDKVKVTTTLAAYIKKCNDMIKEANMQEVKLIGNVGLLKSMLKQHLADDEFKSLQLYVYQKMLVDAYQTVCRDLIGFLKSHDKGLQQYFSAAKDEPLKNINTLLIIKIEEAYDMPIVASAKRPLEEELEQSANGNKQPRRDPGTSNGGGPDTEDTYDIDDVVELFEEATVQLKGLLPQEALDTIQPSFSFLTDAAQIGNIQETVENTVDIICTHLQTYYVSKYEDTFVYDDVVHLEECLMTLLHALHAYIMLQTTLKQESPTSPMTTTDFQQVKTNRIATSDHPNIMDTTNDDVPEPPATPRHITPNLFFEDKPPGNPLNNTTPTNKYYGGALARHLSRRIQSRILQHPQSFFPGPPIRNLKKKNKANDCHNYKMQYLVLCKLKTELQK